MNKKRSRNDPLFRITQAVCALGMGLVALWLIAMTEYAVLGWIFAVGAAFALVDVMAGLRPGDQA